MPKKFDQEAKDRVVRSVEDRILAENTSTQEACKIVAHSEAVHAGRFGVFRVGTRPETLRNDPVH